MSGVPIAETDAVPSVVPVAHQTLCTEDTENDIGLVPAPMTVLESGVPQNEIPVVQCPAYGIVSQHMYSSAKPKRPLQTLPSMGESLTLNRKDRTAHTDDDDEYVYMQAVRRESSPESNTLVRNESLEIDPTDDDILADHMSGVQIAESDAVRPAHGIASQQKSANPKRPLPPLPSMDAKPKPLLPPLPSLESLTLNQNDRTAHADHVYEYGSVPLVRRDSSPESNTLEPPPEKPPSMASPATLPPYAKDMSYPLQVTGQQSHQPQPGYPPKQISTYPSVLVSYPYPHASSASPQTRYSYPQAVGTPAQSQHLAGRPLLQHQTTFPPPAGSFPAHQPQQFYYRAPQPQVQVPQQAAVHAPIQRQVSAPVVQMAAGPSSPIGYNVLDLLQGGNLIRLILRNSYQNRPIKLDGSAIRPGGSYTLSDSVLQVVCPIPGVVALRSTSKPYRHIGVTNHKGSIKANIKDVGDQACHFRVHAHPDLHVCFESMKFPGVFLNVSKKKCTGVEDWNAQFRVRAEAILSSLSTPLMTLYGRPSVANNLPDKSIIQLYSKSTQSYLCIKKSGAVKESVNEKLTYLLYRDRGMGIVSLDAYQRPGYRLRMFNNVLQGKGEPGLSADFYFKDNSDGSVSFESVLCLGGFVYIPSATPQSKLYIYKIHQGYDAVLKIPIN